MSAVPRHHRHWLYLLFAFSGFSGLIYESIWSHYLKLFLGHAAYAQTLVLMIFMGGMAIGAWLPSHFGVRWKNLLLRYALVEIILGLCAVIFHKLFINVTDIAYDSVIPMLGSPWTVNIFKWSLAAILILPQSILLGMTFPLMSAGLIRRYPQAPGASLAMLYFTNSLGAAIGVLVGGFVLIEQVGLPGTILTAGLINIAVGLVAWLFARGAAEPASRSSRHSARAKKSVLWRTLIAASFLTGAASFIYEISWIRMLNLVLGTSTHAFELMLSAFIIGLALGGFWIKHRIDQLEEPVRFLGWIQVIMGTLALITVVAYNSSFSVMQLLMRSVTATDSGYFIFNLGSHGIAILIMVPVTFCAGMTLPLITHTLLQNGHGEKSIGAVYAANTAGAIIGVFFAVHIGMSALGLKGLITAGAALDMGLGIVLLATLIKVDNRRSALIATFLTIAALVAVTVSVQFDRYKMASGVYRHGHFHTPESTEIIFHKDGKTASVDLLKSTDGSISIVTNGKPDARIVMSDNAPPSNDESTMILAGSLPLLFRPEARSAANIGMGSGLTTHVLLNSPNLERVDTIEIEPAMIEAARGFRPRVEAPFSDPRSHFHIDDAKSFFSANKSQYDIIVSEPSNPWVSGVSGLYTDEFYRRARTHLRPGALFVQWLHVYEMDFDLVASVMKAIGRNFSDYVLYAANDGDLLIIAVKNGKVPAIDKRNMDRANLTQTLRRIDIRTYEDIQSRRIGDRTLLEPLFIYTPVPVNSDFFPILDLRAVRARFMKHQVTEMTLLGAETLPALEMLGEKVYFTENRITSSEYFLSSRRTHAAITVRNLYATGVSHAGNKLDPYLLRDVLFTLRLANDCRGTSVSDLWLDSASNVMNAIIPYLKPSETQMVWRRLRSSDCYRQLQPVQQDVFALFGAIGRRDAPLMATLAEKLLKEDKLARERDEYLLAAGMLGYLTDKQPEKALYLWKSYAPQTLATRSPSILLRLLWSLSVQPKLRQAETVNRP